MAFQRVAILGVGLLGGSLGMALKALPEAPLVTGWGHRRSTLQTALDVGAIDHAADSAADAVRGAGLVVLCTPVSVLGDMLRAIAPELRRAAIVTDVGSTKRSVVAAAGRLLAGKARFVGSHPMAGSERRGVEFARSDLFAGALCIITPDRGTSRAAIAKVERFWTAIGMRTTRLSPTDHDRLLADISHLPHALAAALVAMQADEGLPLAGKGFLDTTRIAGGDGALWRDILLDNRDNIRRSLGRLRRSLDTFDRLLDRKDGQALVQWLNAAAERRADLLAQKLREVNPD